MEIQRHGNMETWTWDMETWRNGDMKIWRHGRGDMDVETWRYGHRDRDMQT
jgi:hypothetical protein